MSGETPATSAEYFRLPSRSTRVVILNKNPFLASSTAAHGIGTGIGTGESELLRSSDSVFFLSIHHLMTIFPLLGMTPLFLGKGTAFIPLFFFP
jgi:hypothetical protein